MIALEENYNFVTLFDRETRWRRVVFDVDKIDRALYKAAEQVMDTYCLVENINARLSVLSQKFMIAFKGVKI